MASNCTRVCFDTCAFPMNFSSGDLATIRSDLDSMARCMTHVCQLDFLGRKNTTDLARVYQQLSSSMEPFMNETYDFTGCRYSPPTVTLERDHPKYAVPILGYLFPIIIFLTIINNSLVFIVLMKPHMRSPTNAILVAIALSDLFAGLCLLPVSLHFHATERFYEWVPYNWCYAYDMFGFYIPTIFHTASIWLTVALTVQRYICVCHPFKARTWCTIRNLIYATVVIYIVATLTEIQRIFWGYFVETEAPSLLRANQYVSACVLRLHHFVAENLDLYLNIYAWCRAIFVNSLSCLSLVVMNALLIHTLRVARRRRQQLLGQHMDSERRKLEESNSTTLMLVVVVCVFLLVEIPTAIRLIFYTFINKVIERNTMFIWALFNDLFILLSSPLNFFIYCSMSRKFRDTFKQLFNCSFRLFNCSFRLFNCSFRPFGKKDSPNMAVSPEERRRSLVPEDVIEEPV